MNVMGVRPRFAVAISPVIRGIDKRFVPSILAGPFNLEPANDLTAQPGRTLPSPDEIPDMALAENCYFVEPADFRTLSCGHLLAMIEKGNSLLTKTQQRSLTLPEWLSCFPGENRIMARHILDALTDRNWVVIKPIPVRQTPLTGRRQASEEIVELTQQGNSVLTSWTNKRERPPLPSIIAERLVLVVAGVAELPQA